MEIVLVSFFLFCLYFNDNNNTNMIKYIVGDATEPIGDGIKIIAHVCNDIGAWGAGFVMALSAKWVQPETEFRRIPAKKRKLGYVQYIPVGGGMYVANMIAQKNIKPNEFGVPPVRYEAVEVCLRKVVQFARSMNNGASPISIHIPLIGCGLAGGKWSIMSKIIEEVTPDDITMVVYDFDGSLDRKYFKREVGFTTSHGSIPKDERV